MGKRVNKELQKEQDYLDNQKKLEDKNIIERHTMEGKFNLSTALQELDNKSKRMDEMIYNLNIAMEFVTAWFEQNAKTAIQVEQPRIELLK